jgi:predicted neutral ceramidase superfamily lipid hydrolase
VVKSLFKMTGGERRAAVAGVNLFFAALLGANLGSLSIISLKEHIYLAILIAGAVSGLFVAAVSARRTMSVAILIAYAMLLGTLVLVPRSGLIEAEAQVQTIVATLAVWTVFLLVMRLTPILPDNGAEAMAIEDEIGSPDRGAKATGLEVK